MIKYIIVFVLCSLVGIVIGSVIRKKYYISKKIDDIIVVTLSACILLTGVLFSNFTNVSYYDQRVYIPSTFWGLSLGWMLSMWLVKKRNVK